MGDESLKINCTDFDGVTKVSHLLHPPYNMGTTPQISTWRFAKTPPLAAKSTMPRFKTSNSLSAEQYEKAIETLRVLCGMLLLEFGRYEADVREHILRNLIARAATTAVGVFRLWQMKDYQDCWILQRSLLDRLFHLHAMSEENEFALFETWSFKKQYEAVSRLKSDPDARYALGAALYEATPEQKLRYKEIVKNPPLWHRPKAEDVAKAMDLGFLYSYGYDFASRHVHPMADDGQEDFYNITGLEPRPLPPDCSTVISNTVLVATLIVGKALNASRLSWHRTVFEAVNGITNFLIAGSPTEHLPMIKLSAMFKDNVPLSALPESTA